MKAVEIEAKIDLKSSVMVCNMDSYSFKNYYLSQNIFIKVYI